MGGFSSVVCGALPIQWHALEGWERRELAVGDLRGPVGRLSLSAQRPGSASALLG